MYQKATIKNYTSSQPIKQIYKVLIEDSITKKNCYIIII